ncbi:hypothetical protein F1640_12295 [Novosphingobium sp. NBM11]|uniref:caspase family protein n=2 Tax=Pseudomonadota TaxID=1224 RepID=UPI0018921424|nr:caspase family protein [Novosphingobium sp. NBM11]MBF5090781.1 hypothetical protein [Novosphingobium sp. NBM11]
MIRKVLAFALFLLAQALAGPAMAAAPPSPRCDADIASDRVALVVGNRRYLDQHWDQLDNARSDSRQVCAAFAASGFRVILLEDASRDDLAAAVALFGDLAAKAETAVFYFAGHGFEYAGDNYLVPSDAPTETSRANLRGLFVNLAEPLAAANRAKHPVAFLDACRSRAAIVRIVDADEKGPDGPPGFIGLPDRFSGVVFYSTARGSVAYDARPFPTGTNSPFASAVVDWLATPGVNLTDYIGFVMEDVKSGTQRFPYGVQSPIPYGQLPDQNRFYLRRAAAVAPAPPVALPAAPSAMAEARAAIAVITPDDLAREDGPILAARVLKRARPEQIAALAGSGDEMAQYVYGTMLYLGLGVPRDLAGARGFLADAARGGNPAVLTVYAYFLQFLGDRPGDRAEALRVYAQAAEAGYAKAQSNLAYMLYTASPPEQDRARALALWRAAAGADYPYAAYALGYYGGERDAARTRLAALAAAGSRSADNWLCQLEAGTAPEQKPETVFANCLRAAQDNRPVAMAATAWLYATGKGVAVSAKEAKYWARLARNALSPSDAQLGTYLDWYEKKK